MFRDSVVRISNFQPTYFVRTVEILFLIKLFLDILSLWVLLNYF